MAQPDPGLKCEKVLTHRSNPKPRPESTELGHSPPGEVGDHLIAVRAGNPEGWSHVQRGVTHGNEQACFEMKPTRRPIDILLVEDNPGDVRLMAEALKQARSPNRLWVVSDGEKALAYLRQQGRFSTVTRPDIIILDLNLPKKSGREVLADIKTDPQLKRIPVVVLSASTASADIVTCYDLNANCYVSKPLNLDDYMQALQTVEDFWLQIAKLPREWGWKWGAENA